MFPSGWGVATTPFRVLAWNWRMKSFRTVRVGRLEVRCFFPSRCGDGVLVIGCFWTLEAPVQGGVGKLDSLEAPVVRFPGFP